jgi:hypothetical protein
MCICVYVYMCICVYVYMSICVYVYINFPFLRIHSKFINSGVQNTHPWMYVVDSTYIFAMHKP